MDNQKRKVILDLAVSLDGFIEGPNREVDWCIMDDDMDFIEFLNKIDTILYGRKSYELWGQYTPASNISNAEKELWHHLHQKEKIVFSKSKQFNDHNVQVISDNLSDYINQLKSKPGKDIWLYGGATLITTFIHLNLIDEYRLSVHPIILGNGKPLFKDIKNRIHLRLSETRSFSSGVVQLIYHLK